MPDYSLVVNSQFHPFSYQDMLAPVAASTQAQQAIEDQYSNISQQAGAYDKLLNADTESRAYNQYRRYQDDLATQVEQLSKEGLTPASRQAMLNMKKRYAQEITPIDTAWKNREEQRKAQEQMLAQDNTLLLSRHAAATSLDDYLKNPELSYTPYSGKMATAQVAQVAGALAKELKSYGSGKPLDAYTSTFMKNYGFSSGQVLQAIQNPKDPNSSHVLNAIVDQVVGSTGIKDWNDQQALQRVQDYARQGLWSAVGTTEVTPRENFGTRAVLSANLADNNARKAEERAAARAKQQQLNRISANPLNIFSAKEQVTAKNNINAYKDFFTTDKQGRVIMTPKGLAAYKRKVEITPDMASSEGTIVKVGSTQKKYTDSPFKQFIDSLGGNKYITSSGYQPGNIGNLWAKYNKSNDVSKYDANKVTEYDYPIDKSQQEDMKDAILTSLRGMPLKEVDYDNKVKKFKPTNGNDMTVGDLVNEKVKVTATRFSPYGSSVMVQDAKGVVHRYQLPAGINTSNEQSRDKAMEAMQYWQDMYNTGKFTYNGVTRNATPSELEYAKQKQADAIQEAYLYHSQLGLQNKTIEQEFGAYGH